MPRTASNRCGARQTARKASCTTSSAMPSSRHRSGGPRSRRAFRSGRTGHRGPSGRRRRFDAPVARQRRSATSGRRSDPPVGRTGRIAELGHQRNPHVVVFVSAQRSVHAKCRIGRGALRAMPSATRSERRSGMLPRLGDVLPTRPRKAPGRAHGGGDQRARGRAVRDAEVQVDQRELAQTGDAVGASAGTSWAYPSHLRETVVFPDDEPRGTTKEDAGCATSPRSSAHRLCSS